MLAFISLLIVGCSKAERLDGEIVRTSGYVAIINSSNHYITICGEANKLLKEGDFVTLTRNTLISDCWNLEYLRIES